MNNLFRNAWDDDWWPMMVVESVIKSKNKKCSEN